MVSFISIYPTACWYPHLFTFQNLFLDCYVADEIITSAAGVRVRVGNTDAEGRMAMTDPLFHTKQQVCTYTLFFFFFNSISTV